LNRLTERNIEGHYIISVENIENAIQKLGIFEDAYDSLMESQKQIPKELESLRLNGKEKTVTYRETMARKIMNNNIVMFFEKHGLT
jgi:hypothetical protein